MTSNVRSTRTNKNNWRHWYKRAYQRFQNRTPMIARWIRNISAFISGASLAVMTALISAQAVIPEWFNKAYPYLIGLPAAVAFAFQFAEENDKDDTQHKSSNFDRR